MGRSAINPVPLTQDYLNVALVPSYVGNDAARISGELLERQSCVNDFSLSKEARKSLRLSLGGGA
jgi:hypothetical protein